MSTAYMSTAFIMCCFALLRCFCARLVCAAYISTAYISTVLHTLCCLYVRSTAYMSVPLLICPFRRLYVRLICRTSSKPALMLSLSVGEIVVPPQYTS